MTMIQPQIVPEGTYENDIFISRMINWKFYSAESTMPSDLNEDQKNVVEALANTFGNVGWFDGNMAIIVAATVASVVGYAQ